MSKVFLFLKAVFGGQCGGLLFSVAAHSSHLALKCQRFCRQFSGDSVAAFYCKNFWVGHSEYFFIQAVFTKTNCLRPFNQAAIFLFKQVLNLSPAANKGIAASRAWRCYLRLQLAISFGFGRTSIFELLFVIFYICFSGSSSWGRTQQWIPSLQQYPTVACNFKSLLLW